MAAITRSRKWNRSNAVERILNLSKGLSYLCREGNCQKGQRCDSQHPPFCFFPHTRTRHRSDSFPFTRTHEKRIGGESKEKSTAVPCQKSQRNFDVSCNRGHTEAEVDKALPSAKSMVKFTRGALSRIAPRDNSSSSETPMAVPEGWDSNSPTLAQSDPEVTGHREAVASNTLFKLHKKM